MRENGIKLLCEYGNGRKHFVFVVFSKRSESINIRAFTYLMESIAYQGLELIKLHHECKEYLDLCMIKPSFMLVISDTKQSEKKPEKYIFSSSDNNCEVKVENPLDELNGTTLVVVSNFMLSQEQVKTPREKWSYFLKHGHPGNQYDLKKIVGNNAMFKSAYEALNMDHWSKKEISQYEEYIQRKAQEDAEGYVTPDPENVFDAESEFSDLKESFELGGFPLTEELSDSERFPLIEESSNSEEEREEKNALFMLGMIEKRREERRKWKMMEMKRKASLEKVKEQKMKKAEVKEGEVKKKAELKKKG
jgi:hypothetical protein